MRPAAFALPFLLIGAALPASADPLLDRLIAEARTVTVESLAFQQTVRRDFNGKVETRVERFDGSRPAGSRWSLVSIDGREPTSEQVARHAREMRARDPAYYGRLAQLLDGAEKRRGPNGETVYHVASLKGRGAAAGGNFAGLASRFALDATVGGDPDRPYVKRLRVYAPQPFRYRVIINVRAFEAVTEYQRQPDGRPQVVTQRFEASGAALGMRGTIRNETRIGDYRPVAIAER